MKKILVGLMVVTLFSCSKRKELLTGKSWKLENFVDDNKIQSKTSGDEDVILIFNEDGSIDNNGSEKMFDKWRFKSDSLILTKAPLIGFNNEKFGEPEDLSFYIEQLTANILTLSNGGVDEKGVKRKHKIIFVR